MFHIALYEPEIPPNTGNIARLCAATFTGLHIVGVTGFRMDDRTLKRSQSGLGIGLAMAHRLMKMHSGALEAASGGLGQGSTFTVRLPLDTD